MQHNLLKIICKVLYYYSGLFLMLICLTYTFLNKYQTINKIKILSGLLRLDYHRCPDIHEEKTCIFRAQSWEADVPFLKLYAPESVVKIKCYWFAYNVGVITQPVTSMCRQQQWRFFSAMWYCHNAVTKMNPTEQCQWIGLGYRDYNDHAMASIGKSCDTCYVSDIQGRFLFYLRYLRQLICGHKYIS